LVFCVAPSFCAIGGSTSDIFAKGFPFARAPYGPVLFTPRIALIPYPFRQRQTGEVFCTEPAVRLDTEAFEHGDQLAHVLRRVPSGTLEQLVHRRCAVKGPDLLLAGFVHELAPPVFNSLNNTVAISRDFHSGRAAPVCGRHVGIVRPVLYIVYRGLKESLADAKDMMAQQLN